MEVETFNQLRVIDFGTPWIYLGVLRPPVAHWWFLRYERIDDSPLARPTLAVLVPLN